MQVHGSINKTDSSTALFDKMVSAFLDEKQETRLADNVANEDDGRFTALSKFGRFPRPGPILATPNALMNPDSYFESI
jgi:hypothetical protein